MDISVTWSLQRWKGSWHFIGYFSLPIHCRDVKDLTFHVIFQLKSGHCRDVKGLTFHWIFQLTYQMKCQGPDISSAAYLAIAEMWRTWHFIWYFNLPGTLQRCEGHDISLDISTYLSIAEMWRTWHFIGYFNLPGHCRDVKGLSISLGYFRLPGHCRDVKDLTFHWIFQLTYPLHRCQGPDISLDISTYLANCRDMKDLTFHVIFQFIWPVAEMWRAWHFIGYFRLPGHCRDVKVSWHFMWYFSLPIHCRDVKVSWHFIGYFRLPGHLQRCEGPDISLIFQAYLAIAEMWRAWHFIGYFITSNAEICQDLHLIFQFTWPLQRCEGPDISLEMSAYLITLQRCERPDISWPGHCRDVKDLNFIGYFKLPGHCRDVKDLTFHWIFQLTWPLQRWKVSLTFHWIFQLTWPLQRCEGKLKYPCEMPGPSHLAPGHLAIAEMWRIKWHFIGYFSLPGHCRDVKDLTFHLIFQAYLAIAEIWRAWHFIGYFSLPGHLQRCEGPDISLDISGYLAIAEMWR